MDNTELKEKLEIRGLAVDDHKEGRRPFATEYLDFYKYFKGGDPQGNLFPKDKA